MPEETLQNRITKKEELKRAMDSLQKIREELHLKDDYAYNEAFGK